MTCPHCHNYQHDSNRFCGYCGRCLIRTVDRPVWGGNEVGAWDAMANIWVVALLGGGSFILFGAFVMYALLVAGR